jgi:shikimate kinase
MCLDVMGYASYAPYNKGAYELIWSDPEFDTNKERSDAVNAYITALVKARGNGIMSDKEIHTTLTKHNIVELNSDFDEHIKELDETTERKSEESVDKNAAANDDMTDRYANQDYDNTAVEDVDKNSDAE